MGNKSIGKRETKKPAKKQAKVAPGRRREEVSPSVARIGQKPADSN